MADPIDTAQTAASLLPQLEPMAGAGLAITLAYLNLERFRYRKTIRDKARQHYQNLSKLEYFDLIEHFDEVGLLRDLAGWKDHDHMGDDPYESADEQKRPVTEQRSRFLAEGLYFVFFRGHRDRYFCMVAALYCSALLFFGVAHSIHTHVYSAEYFDSVEEAHNWLRGLSACVFVPMFFVWLGNRIVRALKKKSEEAFRKMEKLMTGFAERAKLGN